MGEKTTEDETHAVFHRTVVRSLQGTAVAAKGSSRGGAELREQEAPPLNREEALERKAPLPWRQG